MRYAGRRRAGAARGGVQRAARAVALWRVLRVRACVRPALGPRRLRRRVASRAACCVLCAVACATCVCACACSPLSAPSALSPRHHVSSCVVPGRPILYLYRVRLARRPYRCMYTGGPRTPLTSLGERDAGRPRPRGTTASSPARRPRGLVASTQRLWRLAYIAPSTGIYSCYIAASC
jgi:hypothetical protein